MRRWPVRILLGTLALALGVWVGVCCVAVHSEWYGAPLTVAATVTATLALASGWARTCFVLGWGVAVGIAVSGRPEGDWAVAADWQGYTLLLTGLVVLGMAAATIPRRVAESENPRPST